MICLNAAKKSYISHGMIDNRIWHWQRQFAAVSNYFRSYNIPANTFQGFALKMEFYSMRTVSCSTT